MSPVSRDPADEWALLSRLYHEALTRDQSEREAFLQQACPDDEELRNEVRSMLARADSNGPSDPFGIGLRPPAVSGATGDPWIGRDVAGYRIASVLGRGGMGVVYKATDTKLRRPVAIKFLPPAVGDAAARARFLREAQTASSLNHPHILTVHDAGEIEGRQYLVTEYVDGGTLRSWAQAEPRSPGQIVDLLIGIADGLATAHDAGIVHRDVKPENILVTTSGYAKLADFGLAKPIASAQVTHAIDDDPETVTRTGVVVGTIAYMAPELATGGSADARSDVFAFGIVLHELLAGRRPFAASSSLEELQRIIHGSPDPLPASVPKTLRDVVGRALEKLPARRYQTMREMISNLRAAARANESTPARPERYSRRIAAAVLAVIVLALGGYVAQRWSSPSASASTKIGSIAVLPFKNLSGDPGQEYFSDGMTEALISNLAQIHALRVISRTSVMRFKNMPPPIPEIGRALGVDAVVESSIQRDGTRVRVIAQLIRASTDAHLWAKAFDGSTDDLLALQSDVTQAIANEIRAQVTSQEKARIAAVRKVAPGAQDAYLLGRYLSYKQSKEGYEGAIRAYQRAIAVQPDYAAAYAGLAEAWRDGRNRGFFDDRGEARRTTLKAVEIDPDDAEAQAQLANQRSEDWDWDGAERAFRRTLELNPDSVHGCSCYGVFLAAWGRTSEAIPLAEHAVQVSPLAASTHANLGFVLFHARRFDQAVPPLERALELEPGNRIARMLLSEVYLRLGRDADGLRIGKGINDSYTAALYAAQKEGAPEAERILEGAVRKGVAPGQYWSAAVAYMRLGDRDRAFEYLTKDFDLRSAYIRWARASPWFDQFRSDPRFDALVKRLHLPS